MPQFQIKTPVPNWSGVGVAGIAFANGVAIVDSENDKGYAALSYAYGRGYQVEPLDENGPSVLDVLESRDADPVRESAKLDAEIKALESARDLQAKRKHRDELREQVYGAEQASAQEQADHADDGTTSSTLTPGEGPTITEPAPGDELLAPPAENASADSWRTWVVDSGRATEDEVAGKSRTELIQTYGAAYDRDREAQLKGGTSA